MNAMSRRGFVQASAVSLAAGLLSRSGQGAEPLSMTLSLAAYSFQRELNLKKQPKPTMTLEEFIDFAATTPAKAVELTSYYFRESTPEYLDAIKARCAEKKLAISGSAVGNDFCLADPAARRQEAQLVRTWIGHTARLGGKTLRIFAGKVPKGDTEEAALERCIAAIRAVCETAEKAGVLLAVENHGGITATPKQLLAIVEGVNHPSCGINLDSGNFHGDDPYAELEQVVSRAVNVQVKTEVQPKGQKKQEADLKRIVGILKKVNYRGAVALEYEAAADPRTAVPRYMAELRALLA